MVNDLGLRLYYYAADRIKGDSIKPSVLAEKYLSPSHQTIYVVDFNEISTQIPLGVERFDISGDTRKTVQLTRGVENQGDGTFSDNTYVDTWSTSPNKIVLAGVVKMPEAITVPVIGTTVAGKVKSKTKTFLGMIEEMYYRNSLPKYQQRGDYMKLFDFVRQQELTVTIKSRRYPLSVDRPMLVSWELEFIVLEQVNLNDLQRSYIL